VTRFLTFYESITISYGKYVAVVLVIAILVVSSLFAFRFAGLKIITKLEDFGVIYHTSDAGKKWNLQTAKISSGQD
jgi:photosystem II stability/assembly factor-like uncharacterized protein